MSGGGGTGRVGVPGPGVSVAASGALPHRVRGALFALAVLAHGVFLYLPDVSWFPHIGGLTTLTHMTVFGAVLYTGARFGLSLTVLVAALVGHAVLSELAQHWFLPHRVGDWHNAAADVIGVGFGYLLLRERRR